jgi:hypothetical protein
MKEYEKVLTRHDVVGLLEEAIYGAEQFAHDRYLADKLSRLAHRIASGEAGFVEYDEEGAEETKEIDLPEVMLDIYGEMLNGDVGQRPFRALVASLSDEEVIEIIGWAWNARRAWEEEEQGRNAIKGDEPTSYTHIVSDDEPSPLYGYQSLSAIPSEQAALLRAIIEEGAQRSTQEPRANTLNTQKAMIEALKQDAVKPKQEHKPEPKKTKNTRETILEGLEKGKLALNLISELYTKEQDKE